MGYRKSSYLSLRHLFETEITVNHISEKIVSCHIDDSVEKARSIMVRNGFHCLGVEENGRIFGYVRREDVEDSKGRASLRELVRIFRIGEIVSETTSIIEVMFFEERDRVLLKGMRLTACHPGRHAKTPVRLLIFAFFA